MVAARRDLAAFEERAREEFHNKMRELFGEPGADEPAAPLEAAAPAQAPAPEAAATVTPASFTGPRTPSEQLVAAVWRELLGVDLFSMVDEPDRPERPRPDAPDVGALAASRP